MSFLLGVQNISFWKRAVALILLVIFVNAFVFNHYFPLTEGWWSLVAKLIEAGRVPYRDFFLYLPPLYPYEIFAFSRVFGEGFLQLRAFGVLHLCVAAILQFYLLSRIFPLWASWIAAAVGTFLLQSTTFLVMYDYNVQAILVPMGIAAIIVRKHEKNTMHALWVLFCGFLAGCNFLIKQNAGVLYLPLFLVSILVLSLANRSSLRSAVVWQGAAVAGFLFPLVLCAAWLARNHSVGLFFDQVFIAATGQKGSITTILFAWLEPTIATIPVFVLTVSLLFIFAFGYRFKFFENSRSLSGENGISSVAEFALFGLFLLLAGLVWLLPENRHIAFFSFGAEKLLTLLPVFSVSLCLVGGVLFLGVMLSKVQERIIVPAVLFQFGIILIYHVSLMTTSGQAIFSRLSFWAAALVLAWLLVHGRRARVLGMVAVVGIAMSIFVSSVSLIFHSPFSWWGYNLPSVRSSQETPASTLLKGFSVDSTSAEILSDLQFYRTLLSKTDQVFSYPHIPSVYLFLNKLPFTWSPFHWYDVANDAVCFEDARRLREAKPKLIVLFEQSNDDAMRNHEVGFRAGKESGQRRVIKEIREMTRSPDLGYKLERRHSVGSGFEFQLWMRQ